MKNWGPIWTRPAVIWNIPDPPVSSAFVLIQPPAGKIVRLLSGHIRLTTSAVVGNREIVLNWQDASGESYGPTGPNYVQTAGNVRSYALMSGTTAGKVSTDEGHLVIPVVPELWILQGCLMTIILAGVQAGDAFTDINFSAEMRDA